MTQCIILTGGTSSHPMSPKIQRSLGPYRVATALEDKGYTTFVLDYIVNLTLDEIKQALEPHLGEDTLWVGFSSTFFWNTQQRAKTKKDSMYYTTDGSVEQLLRFIKDTCPAKIVYGGAKAPFYVGEDPLIDFYVAGYADNSTVALTDYLMHNDISYLPHHENVNNSMLIDSYKYPEPTMKELTTRYQNILPGEGLPLELARGCIFKCKFCSYPLLGKKKGTYIRDPEQVKDELIELWETHGTDSYYITDDTFNDDNDKIETLHKVFTSLPFKPKFSTYLRLDLIHTYPHQADLLTEMGLIGTYFGLETLQPQSAITIGKGLHPDKVKDRLYWLDDRWHNKVNIAAGFILGLPHDSHEYFKELLLWAQERDNPIDFIDFYALHLFNRSKDSPLSRYDNEFSLNPEIYGYEFPYNGDNQSWVLKDKDLNFRDLEQVAAHFRHSIMPRNKFAEFQMITALNTGISLNDLYTLTIPEIERKYQIDQMNANKLAQYKNFVGIGKQE